MRILFMGTPQFAAISLTRLLTSGHEIIGVVTQPDRPKDRGMQLGATAVKTVALDFSLTLWQPEKIDNPDFVETFRSLQPDLVIVVAFGQKIPGIILETPPFGCINVHGSLLPKYRGAAPIQWSILNGDATTGVTTIYMDEGWDTGDIIYQQTLVIDPDENLASLYQRLAEAGAALLIKTIQDVAAKTAPRVKQNNTFASLAPKLSHNQSIINWSGNARTIHNQVRAFSPAPGAETSLGETRLKIIKTRMITPDTAESSRPGQLLQIVKNQGILVATGQDQILLQEVQPLGKRVMTAYEFANGRHLKAGMIFA